MKLLVRLFLIIGSLLVFLPFLIGCRDGEHPITIDNRTDLTLEIFWGSGQLGPKVPEKYSQIGTVGPKEIVTIGRSYIFTHYFNHPYLIEVKTERGVVVFSEWHTPKELEKMGWKIVIEPEVR